MSRLKRAFLILSTWLSIEVTSNIPRNYNIKSAQWEKLGYFDILRTFTRGLYDKNAISFFYRYIILSENPSMTLIKHQKYIKFSEDN